MSTQENTGQTIPIQQRKLSRPTSFYRVLSGVSKRAFDLIVSLFGLLLLFPIFIVIARWIKRETPGPAFYRGPRMGRNGRIFQMLKFRTMYENSESYSGPRLTVRGDSRITPLGKWLRDTKINELPQLWNVLIGDMSLVGPRPEDPEIAKSWPEEVRSRILTVRPGVTSPASVLYHDEEKLLSKKGGLNEYYESILPEKNRLDLLYVDHHSFFSDLDTIFWTLTVLVPKWVKIDLDLPETHFFSGPFARIGHRYFSWFLVDLVTSLAVIGGCAVLWRAQFPLNWGVSSIIFLGVILSLLFSGVNSVARLNRIDWVHATAEDVFGLILSSTCVTGLIVGLNYLESIYRWLGPPQLPTLMIIFIGFLAGSSFIFTRYRIRLLSIIANWWLSLRRNTLVLGERLLIVGDGEGSRMATWLLNRPMFRTAFSVVGMINDNDPTKKGMRINGYWMLGSTKDIPAIIKRRDIGVILSAAPAAERETTEYIFDLCQKNNLRLIFLRDLMLMLDQQLNKQVGTYEYPAWLEQRLAFKAMYDDTTGLPTRYLFQDRIKHSFAYARVHKSRLALMFIRIERNNSDTAEPERNLDKQILIEVAGRLAKCGRESDTLALIGNNTFAMILENITEDEISASIAERVLITLSEPIRIEQSDYQIKANIEIKESTDSDSLEELEAFYQTGIDNLHDTIKKAEALN